MLSKKCNLLLYESNLRLSPKSYFNFSRIWDLKLSRNCLEPHYCQKMKKLKKTKKILYEDDSLVKMSQPQKLVDNKNKWLSMHLWPDMKLNSEKWKIGKSTTERNWPTFQQKHSHQHTHTHTHKHTHAHTHTNRQRETGVSTSLSQICRFAAGDPKFCKITKTLFVGILEGKIGPPGSSFLIWRFKKCTILKLRDEDLPFKHQIQQNLTVFCIVLQQIIITRWAKASKRFRIENTKIISMNVKICPPYGFFRRCDDSIQEV